MPFKTLKDVTDPATYQKNVKQGLSDSKGKVAKLQLFEGFAFTNQTAPLVLVGPVDAKLLKQITESGAKLKGKGSVTETDEKIKFKATGVPADMLTKALKIAKVSKDAVAADDLAEATDSKDETPTATTETAPEQSKLPKEAPLSAEKVLEAATGKFTALTARFDKLLVNASDSYKSRLKANKEEFEGHVSKKEGKEALKIAFAVEKMLDDIERDFDQKKEKVTRRTDELQSRVKGFKPALHAKLKEEVNNRIRRTELPFEGKEKIDWEKIEKECDELEERFDEWDELTEEFATESANFHQLKTKAKPLQNLITPKVPLMAKEKKAEFAELIKQVAKLKVPTVLLEKGAWDEAKDAYTRLIDWMEANAAPKGEEETDPVLKRMKAFVYNNPSTWELNAVEYKNDTSADRIGGKAADLANASLASNTTAGGSVRKVNYEGHSHLDGGSGGVAFVYKLNDDYTVTPVVVDVSSKRGGKNGNQYQWDTGGGWAYFPPNASY